MIEDLDMYVTARFSNVSKHVFVCLNVSNACPFLKSNLILPADGCMLWKL